MIPQHVDRRIVGEIVYQLEQRIFNFVFNIEPLCRRDIKIGYEPLNIRETIVNFSMNNNNANLNSNDCKQLEIF